MVVALIYSNPSDSSSNLFQKILSHKIALLNSNNIYLIRGYYSTQIICISFVQKILNQ